MKKAEQRPIRAVLSDRFTESDVQRIWRGVERRMVTRAAARRRRRGALAGVSIAILGVAVWISIGLHTKPGALELVRGGLPKVLLVDARDAPHEVALDDGSSIHMAPGTEVDVVGNDGASFHTVLRHGSATFNVRPKGPRRWTVECELATVEVVGTLFSCEKQNGRLVVSVERGAVLVRGERVPDHVQRVLPGESVVLTAKPPTFSKSSSASPLPTTASAMQPPTSATSLLPTSDPSPSDPSPQAASATSLLPTSDPSPSDPSPQAASATSLLPTSDPSPSDPSPQAASATARPHTSAESDRAASSPAAPRAIASDRVALDRSVDELLRQADVARQTGDEIHAAELLQRVVREAPRDSRTAIAAFTLARLEMARKPARAAENLLLALASQIPRGLEEDARARLVEAHARAGNREAAQRAADDYERRFPAGARLVEVRRWSRGE